MTTSELRLHPLRDPDPPAFLPDRFLDLWRESEPDSLTRDALLDLATAMMWLEEG